MSPSSPRLRSREFLVGRFSEDANAPRALDKGLRSDEAHRSHRVGED